MLRYVAQGLLEALLMAGIAWVLSLLMLIGATSAG
jgi:hypothetical protein